MECIADEVTLEEEATAFLQQKAVEEPAAAGRREKSQNLKFNALTAARRPSRHTGAIANNHSRASFYRRERKCSSPRLPSITTHEICLLLDLAVEGVPAENGHGLNVLAATDYTRLQFMRHWQQLCLNCSQLGRQRTCSVLMGRRRSHICVATHFRR